MGDNNWANVPRPQKQDTSWLEIKRPSTNGRDVDSYVGNAGVQQPDQEKDFDFQLKFGQDNKLLRAQNQGWLEQTGKTLGNTAANIVTGVIRDVGSIGSLATEFGDHKDYSNWLTDAMDKAQNPLGEVYREHPDKVVDFTDSAWWNQQIGGLFEGTGKFGVEAWLTGGLFGSIADGATGAMSLGRTGTQIATTAAKVADAATIGYAWAAQSAGQIYKQSYDHQYQKLVDKGANPVDADHEARHIASQAAASTAHIGTAFNTLFGLTALAPMFKQGGVDALSKEFTEGSLAMKEGEELGAYNERLKGTSLEGNPQLKKALSNRDFLSSYPSQAIQMSGMGLGTEYATKEGEREGETGKIRSLKDQLTDFSQMLKDTTNQEGALNLAIGLFAGPLHSFVIDHITPRYIAKYDAEGNPIFKKGIDDKLIPDGKGGWKQETQMVSSKSFTQHGARQYFENVRDALTTDMDNFQKLNEDLQTAVTKKDAVKADLLRNEIFSVGMRDAVMKGLTRHWQKTFQDIAGIDNSRPLSEQLQPQIDEITQQLEQATTAGDNDAIQQLTKDRQDLVTRQANLADVTQAMQRGFARSKDDNEYKQRAGEAVRDLDKLQSLHDSLQRDYYSSHDPQSGELVDHLFHYQSKLYLERKILDKYRNELDQEQAELSHLLGTDLANHPLVEAKRKNLEAAEEDYKKTAEAFDQAMSDKGRMEFMRQTAKERKAQLKAINDRNRKGQTNAYLRQQEKEAAAKLDEKQKELLHQQAQDKLSKKEAKVTELEQQLQSKKAEVDEAKGHYTVSGIKKEVKLRNERSAIEEQLKSAQAEKNTMKDQADLLDAQKEKATERVQKVEEETIEDDQQEPDRNEDIPDDALSNYTIDDLLNMKEEPTEVETKPTNYQEAKIAHLKTKQNTDGTITVYRGIQAGGEKGTGQFWTTDRKVAEYYANRDTRESGTPQILKETLPFDTAVQYYMGQEGNQGPAHDSDIFSLPDKFNPLLIHEDEIPEAPIPDSPVIHISNDLVEEEQQERRFNPRPQTVSAVKSNRSDLEYAEYKKTDGTISLMNKVQDDGGPVLDPKVDHRNMVPGIISMGDGVTLGVDTKWDGTINNDQQIVKDKQGNRVQIEDKFRDYLDDKGKIRMEALPGEKYPAYANFPVHITHDKTGIRTGYLPRVDWVTAEQGAENYRNVEDEIDGISGNVQLQVDKLLAIRRKIAEAYNRNPDQTELKTRVSDRTEGQLMYTSEIYKESGNVKKYISRLTKTQLPDSSLTFVVFEGGKPFSGHMQEFDNLLVNAADMEHFSGAPGVMLPTPSGMYYASPLLTKRFAERKGDIHTVTRAIEMYLKHDTKFWDTTDAKHLDLLNKTGFDITTERGLRDFVNQYYTYTHNGFEDVLTTADADAIGGKKVQQFLFSIPDKAEGYNKTLIKVGTTFSGEKPAYAQLKNGKLDDKFRQKLEGGLSQRFKNVTYQKGNMTGINDNKPITEVRINTDGSVWSKVHNSYNDYLKTFTETSVYGKHQIEGKYVYTANSQVLLDEGELMKKPEFKERELPLPQDKVVERKRRRAELLDLENSNLEETHVPESTISPEGEPVSLESLSKLRNFTDEDKRNSKTPEEVIEHLNELGITHLTDGFNPFVKC